MSDIVDLDALVPQAVKIKFGGSEIEVRPPKTGQVLKLSVLGQKLAEPSLLSTEQIQPIIDDLTTLILECVPELKDSVLTSTQLMKLMEIISEMSVPPDAKQLEKQGLEASSPKVTA